MNSMETAASHTFEASVKMAKFISDCEIAAHTTLGMTVFDVRCLKETRLVFAMAACADACEGAFAFAINKEQPVVVLSDGGRMVSWQVTTQAKIAHLHLTRVGGRCRISAVDEDNFVWSIDEFGIEEKAKARTFAISAPRPREGRTGRV